MARMWSPWADHEIFAMSGIQVTSTLDLFDTNGFPSLQERRCLQAIEVDARRHVLSSRVLARPGDRVTARRASLVSQSDHLATRMCWKTWSLTGPSSGNSKLITVETGRDWVRSAALER